MRSSNLEWSKIHGTVPSLGVEVRTVKLRTLKSSGIIPYDSRRNLGWLSYKNHPDRLTDHDFIEGITNEIKRLRILKEIIDDRYNYEPNGRRHCRPLYDILIERSNQLYKLIEEFSKRGDQASQSKTYCRSRVL